MVFVWPTKIFCKTLCGQNVRRKIMNLILLSGGSGKRLWPLSNDIRSKQFIKIFKTDNGYESMVQRMYRLIRQTDPQAVITLATSKTQVAALHNQLGENVDISIEPCRRDTFPAIALATAYLHDVKGVSEQDAVVVCPVDPYVNEDWFEALRRLHQLAQKGTANLCLLGIKPTYPSEKYGYIIPQTSDEISKVKTFKEKPDAKTAESYIAQGGLWNGGVFAYKIGYVLKRAHELIDFTDYQDLFHKYEMLQKISFDYAIVEKETNIAVMRFNGEWKNLGTWNTFTEVMQDSTIGNVHLDTTCENLHIINELDLPIICMGLKNTVVAASPEGILIADKHQSSYLKPIVDKIVQDVQFAEKSWGSYHVLDTQKDGLTIRITLNPGHKMNYHSHAYRNEVWTIVCGMGRAIVDGMEQPVRPGDVITMQAGCKHTLIADTELKVIEVQLGSDIRVDDKTIYPLGE